MVNKKIANRLLPLMASASMCFSSMATDEIKVPKYDYTKVPPLYCSMYARLAAKDLFGKEYIPSDAWNMQYKNREVCKVETNNIEGLVNNGTLKPGMIVGIYNPKSKYNSKLDQTKRPVEYTHVALYVGNEGTNAVFAHLFGASTLKETSNKIKEKGLVFKEVLDTK